MWGCLKDWNVLMFWKFGINCFLENGLWKLLLLLKFFCENEVIFDVFCRSCLICLLNLGKFLVCWEMCLLFVCKFCIVLLLLLLFRMLEGGRGIGGWFNVLRGFV